jgi:hydroxymethylglutaryl-CoA lyase
MRVPSSSAVVREAGLRDGLQSIARVVPTAHKLEWLRAAHAAGQREIEVGSFVPPRLLPQLADTAELVDAGRALEGLLVSVLVPNLKGAQRAIETGAHLMLFPLSASHAHSLANLRRTPNDAVEELARIRATRDAAGSPCLIEAGISTAFGCTLQGRVEPDEVLRLVRDAIGTGIDRVSLADTVGYADPRQVRELFDRAFEVAGDQLAGAHFHDTRGLGLANVYAAWQSGIRRFDASLAGIGGCPHAPGASGNVATEDVVYLLSSMGVATGQDFDALLRLRAQVATWLDGEVLHGALWRAGLPRTLVVPANAATQRLPATPANAGPAQ